MPTLVRYLTRLCWLMRQGMPVADVLVYVPGQDVFARMGTAVGGSLDAWREARKLIGDDVIRVIRQGGWDFDLVDDESLAVLPADASRAVIISGATALPAAAQAWFEQHVSLGGIVLTVDSAVGIAGATACGVADLDTVLSASCEPDVRLQPRTTDVGVVHRRTAEADIYLVINTGPSTRPLALSPRSARAWYEEWDAQAGEVTRIGRTGEGVELRLHPYQATVIVLSDHEPPPISGADHDHGRQRTLGLGDGWQVQFADRNSSVRVDLPHVWETDPERLAFSGAATYRRTVDVPDLGRAARVEIDFGNAPTTPASQAQQGGLLGGHSFRTEIDPPVGVIAEVRVNDVDCGMAWAPPYVVDVSPAIHPGVNRIEITVRNTAANALAHDEQISSMAADSERRYGRRFRMQELDRAMHGVRSGLTEVPTLVITD